MYHRRVVGAGAVALRPEEPGRADDRQGDRDPEVEAPAEDVVGGVDPQALLEDPEGRVAGDVKGEEAGRADPAVVAEPDQEGGQGEVPDDLVEEGRLEGGVVEVALGAVRGGDLEAPGKVGRAAEELLVEVVADPADRLGDEQGGGGAVHEGGDRDARPVDPPDPDRGARGDPAPDPEPAVPDRERSPPGVGHFAPARDVEVE